MTSDSTRQDFLFYSVISDAERPLSVGEIRDRMKLLGMRTFRTSALVDRPDWLTRVVDVAETDGVIASVGIDTWEATDHGKEVRDRTLRMHFPRLADQVGS
jgi:hypothetical protein